MKVLTGIILITLLASCAMAPMSNTTTARTNGKGEMNLELGANAQFNIPYFRLGYGLFERVDLGLLYEASAITQTAGLWAKIGLLKTETGPSFALIGSYGSSGNDADYYYAGGIFSIKFKMLEAYALVRYNHLEASSVGDIEVGDLFTLPIGTPEYDFWLYNAGLNIWFAHWFGINANATVFSGDLDSEKGLLMFGGGLLFRF